MQKEKKRLSLIHLCWSHSVRHIEKLCDQHIEKGMPYVIYLFVSLRKVILKKKSLRKALLTYWSLFCKIYTFTGRNKNKACLSSGPLWPYAYQRKCRAI